MLNSSVRVTRRAGWRNCTSVPNTQEPERARQKRRVLKVLDCRGGRPRGFQSLPTAMPVTAAHAGRHPTSNEEGGSAAAVPPCPDGDARLPSIRFSLGNFKHSLTLFSKFFSSFPRGTSSLSVPRTYLALDGTYHPIGAAFPNNPTLRQHLVAQQGPAVDGAVTLFGVPFQGTCTRPAAEVASQDYNSGSIEAPGFSVWAIPGSLAATKGILVGFSSSA
eukprot:TRINITY_DN2947_c0_g3_i2.p2 TRINITY_DN2947_c0_g3~~TRINITY_DN2947_c0_g3_i2.p2  ORF type:complete len:219 (+),score=4.30 TRINITY_DN2947_c0_g3_i2:2773-3429(+)